MNSRISIVSTLTACCLASLTTVLSADSGAAPKQPEMIKAYPHSDSHI